MSPTMYKLIILIEPDIDAEAFFDGWPQFLALAEQMPGLKREVSSPVHRRLFGNLEYLMAFELIFDSEKAFDDALASPEGTAAGQMLQTITKGKVTLLTASHLEESIKNLRRYKSKS